MPRHAITPCVRSADLRIAQLGLHHAAVRAADLESTRSEENVGLSAQGGRETLAAAPSGSKTHGLAHGTAARRLFV